MWCKYLLECYKRRNEIGLNVIFVRDITLFRRNVMPILKEQFPDAYMSKQGGELKVQGINISVVGYSNSSSFSSILGSTIKTWCLDELQIADPYQFLEAFGRQVSLGEEAFSMSSSNPDDPDKEVFATMNKCKLIGESPNEDYFTGENEDKKWFAYHMTYEDNPAMDAKKIEELKGQFHGVYYETKILGKRAVAEGLVFDRDAINNCIADLSNINEKALVNKAWIGIDTSYGKNTAKPTWAIEVTGRTRTGALIALYEPDEDLFNKMKAPSDLGPVLDNIYDYVARKYDIRADEIYVDSADQTTLKELYKYRRAHNPKWRVKGVDKSLYDVNDRVKFLMQLMGNGMLLINKDNKFLIRQLKSYRWDEKKEKPIPKLDDFIDGFNYSWMENSALIGVNKVR